MTKLQELLTVHKELFEVNRKIKELTDNSFTIDQYVYTIVILDWCVQVHVRKHGKIFDDAVLRVHEDRTEVLLVGRYFGDVRRMVKYLDIWLGR